MDQGKFVLTFQNVFIIKHMEIMDHEKFVSHIAECIRHKTYGNNGPREVCFPHFKMYSS